MSKNICLLFFLFHAYLSSSYTDRICGQDLSNLWLDVVAVVDNSAGMTKGGLTSVAANIASIFSKNTQIGTNPTSPKTTRLALVTYNVDATTAADLNKFQSIDDIYSGINSALATISSSEESYLARGLSQAEKVFQAGKHGFNRAHYQKVVIVYASTYKGSGDLNPVPVAQRLKTSGVTIITVAYDQNKDGDILVDLEKIATPYHNLSNENLNVIGEIQGFLLQANCFCPTSWIQYRALHDDVDSYRYGICILPVGLTAVWRAAQLSCRNRWRNSYLLNEYDNRKHNFVISSVKNFSGFHFPLSYHIGLNKVNGMWQWDQPQDWTQPQLQNYEIWNSGYPISDSSLTTVLNRQTTVDLEIGWQNVHQFAAASNYVCETAACDTNNYCSSGGDSISNH